MFKKLKIRLLYEDFIKEFMLTEDELKVLNMLILKKSITEISMKTNVCERNISKIIKGLKTKYQQYQKIQELKMKIMSE